jgi:energy-coupling factor transporter ATP-binding protein EcfA2
MKLQTVSVKRYRSALDVQLPQVGDFNVFIGKNNSGKSTLLYAVRVFFLCLKKGDVVALDAPIGKDSIDFSQRNITDPIEITVRFTMQLAERDALIRDIASEAPQLKNAVDGLDPALCLQVSLRISPPKDRFAYTESLALIPPGSPLASTTPARILLRINDLAASELADKLRDIRRHATICENIDKITKVIDEDDFQSMRRAPDESIQQTRFGYVVRRAVGDSPGESGPIIESLLRKSNTYADLRNSAQALIAKYNEQAAAIQSAPLKHPIETFSGQQVSVPQYVLNLIRTIGEIPVLYLTERRKPVGREEAERLLQLIR